MKSGFTMAEAMITMAVIGIVAAITMPILVREVSTRVNSEREANIAFKITKAMENMSVAGDFRAFDSTDEFVDSLQKYLKIVKRCDSDHLSDCWPTNTVIDSNDTKRQVNNAKTGTDLHVKGNTTNNVGIVLADGAHIILTYDQNFKGYSHDTFFNPVEKTLPMGFGKNKTYKYYTSNVTNPIDFVVDVNGSSSPNQETDTSGTHYDIRNFRSASFGFGMCPGDILPDGMCYKILSGFDPIDCRSVNTAKEDWEFCNHGDEYNKGTELTSTANYPVSADYWAGSFKACEKIGMSYYTNYSNAATLVSQGVIPNVFYFQTNLGGPNNGDSFRASNYRYGTYGLNAAGTSVICVKE